MSKFWNSCSKQKKCRLAAVVFSILNSILNSCLPYFDWDMSDSLLIHFFKLVGSFKNHSFSAVLIHRIQINVMCTWLCSSEVKTFGRTALIQQKNLPQDFCLKYFSRMMRQMLLLMIILFSCSWSFLWSNLSEERLRQTSLLYPVLDQRQWGKALLLREDGPA